MSKGSRRRPISASNKAVFDSNWDRIFNKEKERPTWEHQCKHNGTTFLFEDQECEWCGARKDD